MDQNVWLDMIEMLGQERRHNESLAFSTKDASDKARLETAARRDAAAISEIRRRLSTMQRNARHLPSSKQLFDAYIDTLLDTCFEATPHGT